MLLSRIFTFTKIIVYKYEGGTLPESDLEIEAVTEKNLYDAAKVEGKFTFSVNLKNFNNKDEGTYGYGNGALIFRCWTTIGPQQVKFHKYYTYTLKENEVYIHSCLTNEKFRGRGYYSFALSAISGKYAAQNKIVLISTDKKNIASQKGILKAGFTISNEMRIIVVFGIRFIKVYGK